MKYIEATIITVVGIIWSVFAMWIATMLAPVDVSPNWLTISTWLLVSSIGVIYAHKRWGVGFYSVPDDSIATTSTMIHAAQKLRVERWREGYKQYGE